jgi:hypothetical protein
MSSTVQVSNMKLFFFIGILFLNFMYPVSTPLRFSGENEPLLVRRCDDFELTGKGDDPAWAKTDWFTLTKLDPEGEDYETKCKILYSAKGIYVLFAGTDNKVSTQYDQDFGDLFRGDVFEVFFQPDPKLPLYFEYEVNQLSRELVLLIPNFGKNAHGWKPWHYEKDRKVKKMVRVEGGEAAKNASISSWSAELFFPFDLLKTLANVPPTSGTVWHANFYRLDYDSGNMVKWAWSPVEKSFHEYRNFRPICFE